MKRETYTDGRLVPIDGDEVFQMVAGFGGSAACLHGKAYRSKGRGGGLRVKVTSVSALFGLGGGAGKTYPLTPQWSVVNDPELKRREEAREAKRLADQEAAAAAQQRVLATRATWKEKFGDLDPLKLNRGDLVAGLFYDAESIDNEMQFVVGEFWVSCYGKDRGTIGVYGWPADQIEGAPGGLGGFLRIVESGKYRDSDLPEPGIGALTAPPGPAEVEKILAEANRKAG